MIAVSRNTEAQNAWKMSTDLQRFYPGTCVWLVYKQWNWLACTCVELWNYPFRYKWDWKWPVFWQNCVQYMSETFNENAGNCFFFGLNPSISWKILVFTDVHFLLKLWLLITPFPLEWPLALLELDVDIFCNNWCVCCCNEVSWCCR